MKQLLRFLTILILAILSCANAALVNIGGITNPGADSLFFFDYSAGEWLPLTVGSGLTITGTTISASGGGGSISDGDKGDIIVSSSGSVWLVDTSVSSVIGTFLSNKADLGHTHEFGDILNFPSDDPIDVSSMSVPLGTVSESISHSVTVAQAYYLTKVRPSAQNYVMALLREGVTPTTAQLAGIDAFYGWADATGFITGNSSGARLLLTVWDDTSANMINLLDPSDTSTYARIVNSAGLLTEAGYIQTDTGAGSPGYIAFDTTSAAAWTTTDWSMAYYSHLAAQTTDNAMIGGQDDGIASGNRYINTSTATIFRWSPGFTSGGVDYTADTSTTFGLIYFGYKSSKNDARRVKTAGVTVGIDTTSANDAIVTAVPFLGLAYNSEGGATSLSGQPCSLFYIGLKIADDATEASDIAQALYNLAINCGAPEV